MSDARVASVKPSALGRIGRWSARRRGIVALVWISLFLIATLGNRALGGVYSDNFSLPSNAAQQGANLLAAHRPSAGGVAAGQIVFTVATGTLSSDRNVIEQSIASVKMIPDVLAATDPLASSSTSPNGKVAYSTIHFSVNPQSQKRIYVTKFDDATAPARNAGVHVDYGGQLGQAARPKTKSSSSELIGIVIGLLVLLVGFGSVYGAGLPILSALVGAFTGLGILGMIAAATTFASTSPTLAIMMGLGVGIDYSLFLTTRHRQLVMDGMAPEEAAGKAVETSGHAILTAALTVIIALLGLYASGISFLGKLGLAAGITVAVAALGALTIVPALLAKAGTKIDSLQVRQPVAEASDAHAGWQRYAERLGRHPWRYLGSGLVVLVVLAIPFFSMTIGHLDAGSDPPSYTTRQAYDAISNGFGPGANGPLTVVAKLAPKTSATERTTLERSLGAAILATADVAKVTPLTATSDGALLDATVIAKSAPQATATSTLMNALQKTTLPSVLREAGGTGYVTGPTAAALQFTSAVGSRLPVVILVVIAAAFLLLLASFHAPILALKAAVFNLFSIGAAYGVIVAVFQWGWGDSLLGVSEKVPVESYVPMLIFVIVFGLSMDYEVFLLSRIRERWLQSHDNHESVAHGLAETARVISCAALIMASVFLAFLASNNVTVKMIALGLGASVLIDASVIRLLVVPSTMFLLGRYNWWIPGSATAAEVVNG